MLIWNSFDLQDCFSEKISLIVLIKRPSSGDFSGISVWEGLQEEKLRLRSGRFEILLLEKSDWLRFREIGFRAVWKEESLLG